MVLRDQYVALRAWTSTQGPEAVLSGTLRESCWGPLPYGWKWWWPHWVVVATLATGTALRPSGVVCGRNLTQQRLHKCDVNDLVSIRERRIRQRVQFARIGVLRKTGLHRRPAPLPERTSVPHYSHAWSSNTPSNTQGWPVSSAAVK